MITRFKETLASRIKLNATMIKQICNDLHLSRLIAFRQETETRGVGDQIDDK